MKKAVKKTTGKQVEEYKRYPEERVKISTIESTRTLQQLMESKNAAERAFLANTSHELRTPLNAILGYAQILQLEEPTSALLQKGLQTIQTSGEYLLSIINDMLDLARIEAGGNNAQQNDFHLPLLLETLNKMMRIRAEEKNIVFSVQPFDFSQNCPAASLPTVLHGDEKRLRQTLINLVGNAIKFANNGSVVLKAGLVNGNGTTGNKAEKRPSLFRFQVEDTGPGIASHFIETIPSPFQKVEDVRYKIEENGLRLTISRKFIKIMGGQLQIKSSPGQGSIFWFDIPLLQISSQKQNTDRLKPPYALQVKSYAPKGEEHWQT